LAELLSLEEAQSRILARVVRLPLEQVELAQAAGRFPVEPVPARVDLPPFDASAMDGFAVRTEDTPGRLPVVEQIAAGRPASHPLGAGEAMAIATGAAVPEGADAVIPLEYVVDYDNTIEIGERVELGANIRPRGGDLRTGDTVVSAGARLGPAQLGALAAAGVADISTTARPRAAVLSTGSELRRPGETLAPGQIYEVNSVLLATQLASAGPHDLVRSVGRELGIEEVLWGVAVKPGKPLWFGVCDETLVFGLPGNPVSSLVCFELFVRPAVLALQGAAEPMPRFEPGRLARSVRPNAVRTELVRAQSRVVDGEVQLDALEGQDSHMIARAAGADALVLVPAGETELAAGSPVSFLRLA
jgi:molybdopterin molybdotransferase